ncbi:MAG TPA: hypothetical protein VJT74_17370 [Pyrinomonadaceae bacterium]|nr:hypothetical protein [Pyrinomonadaceae bacterium]
MLFLKAKQMQAGADWDTMIGFTVVFLLVAGVAFLLVLVVSRVVKRNRFRSAAARSRKGRR